MKIELVSDRALNYENECNLNPATVCMAQRKTVDDSCNYILHTIDGDYWSVTRDSYESVLAWMKAHE